VSGLYKDNPSLVAVNKLLAGHYADYTRSVSPAGHALSLETAAMAWWMCDKLRPRRLVDLGSGFSSFVLRHWQQQFQAPVIVSSVDDNPAWLERSRSFCASKGQALEGFGLWDSFQAATPAGSLNLVIYDLGRMPVRDRELDRALDLVSPTGVIIIDDMHKYNYGLRVRAALSTRGWLALDMSSVTRDAHEGRHCWVASPNAAFQL
jgi:hypothetical protein